MAKVPRPVKTFKFGDRKYHISYHDAIYGMTDVPLEGQPKGWHMTLLKGGDFRAFSTALHEALEATGMPYHVLHDRDDNSRTEDAARFLWRSWVKPQKKA